MADDFPGKHETRCARDEGYGTGHTGVAVGLNRQLVGINTSDVFDAALFELPSHNARKRTDIGFFDVCDFEP